ncbi:MAG: prolyl oligopeptidase [Candidatus Eremiobacteraeota bacterium]|jgi:prolyl oligopeptidase|nr:prolyl oligopeptidase [Candidatus Eremiobacteraeota bacterium]
MLALIVLLSLSLIGAPSARAQMPTAQPPAATGTPAAGTDAGDPFLWLEDVNGARALAWVKAENAKTLSVLQSDPRFANFNATARKIGEAKDRIPYPRFFNGRIYNFWQDAAHVRGIWRTTSAASYASSAPVWRTVLDLDALAKKERKNWVWGGADCGSPSRTRCLIDLSEGGEDASTLREFDLARERFVPGGFRLPRGKQSAAWATDDALLVSREWGPGTLTASGYAFVVKRLERGKPLSSAVEVARGSKADVNVSAEARLDGRGRRALLILRRVSFFQVETQLLTPAGPRKLNVPLKSSVVQFVAGRLLIKLDEAWAANGRTFPAGALVSVGLADALQDPGHLRPAIVFAPGARQTLGSVSTTRDRVLLTMYENVRGRAFVYTPVGRDGWSVRKLDVPDNSSVDTGAADKFGTIASVYVSGFLKPSTLLFADTGTGMLTRAKAETPKFDASADTVDQRFATSKDGTKIPYFVVHPKHMKLDGSNPTIVNAYGGFSVSLTPYYDGALGKLWLERGGVYVVANIRGGGEFGPAWHEAGLKTHRQVIYDDFAAVAQDLIATKVTTPRHLGIQGGSNGGLLVGVEFTQHPELWNAVDIEVPLLDMLRFEKIQAGASWVGEYGTVAIPDERAFLASISPYDNLKPGAAYPKPFIWTTTKDDRVGPQHARKFAAKLASMGIPYLFYEVIEGGHGAGANIAEQSFTTALAMTYFTQQLMK